MERRTLVDGLKATPSSNADTGREQEFVYGKKPGPNPSPERVPLNTRIRGDFARFLKRTSLERRLEGTEPNTLQEILEEALEPYMRSNGVLR